MPIKNRKPKAKKSKAKLTVIYNFCVVCKDEMKEFGDVCDSCLEKHRNKEKQKK